MRTYLKVFFSSEGATPEEVVKRMESIGWKTVIGDFDFVWEGLSDSVGRAYLDALGKAHQTLSGCKVRYTIVTKR